MTFMYVQVRLWKSFIPKVNPKRENSNSIFRNTSAGCKILRFVSNSMLFEHFSGWNSFGPRTDKKLKVGENMLCDFLHNLLKSHRNPVKGKKSYSLFNKFHICVLISYLQTTRLHNFFNQVLSCHILQYLILFWD